jgi:2-hydroxychromene-2-carboxylate isomerase
MSLRSWLTSRVAEQLTSESTAARRRRHAELVRRRAHAPHVVDYFHQTDDPYSALAAQVLPLVAARYDVELRAHLVNPPSDAAAPERDRLAAWSRVDAARLATRAGLAFADPGRQPDVRDVERAEAALAAAIAGGAFVDAVASTSIALWSGGVLPVARADAVAAKAEGDALRERLGHYLGGTFHYGGEWYWGADRLHYLEARLAALGLRRSGAPARAIFEPPMVPRPDAAPVHGRRPTLHFYLSFRSPYTYIATERARALADAWGAELALRYVLPMVMRGLPVPPAKRRYISLDAAREARRAGIPFGRIVDPVGKPVERGYSLLPFAIAEGKGHAYCLAFMRAVWSQGVDAGSDGGLEAIVEAAGLDWHRARAHLGTDAWRATAEANRQELLERGLWGVPSFRVGDVCAWGQDRLWVVDDALATTVRGSIA